MNNIIKLFELGISTCKLIHNHESLDKLISFWKRDISSITQKDFDEGYEYIKEYICYCIETCNFLSDEEKLQNKIEATFCLRQEMMNEKKFLSMNDKGELVVYNDYINLPQKLAKDWNSIVANTIAFLVERYKYLLFRNA